MPTSSFRDGLLYTAILGELIVAILCIDVIAIFGHWLSPRWHLLPLDAQAAAVIAMLALGGCAIALIISVAWREDPR